MSHAAQRRRLDALLGGTAPLDALDAPPLARWLALSRSAPERQREGAFVVEGLRAVERLLAGSSYPVEAVVLAADDLFAREPATVVRAVELAEMARAAGVPVFAVSARAFRKLADLNKPRGVLAVARIPPTLALDALVAGLAGGVALAAVDLSDAGNLGTLARCCWAFRARALLAIDRCVDPFHPKSLRASAGHLPPMARGRWSALRAACRAHGVALAGLDADPGALPLGSAPAGGLVLCVGSEGQGLGHRVAELDLRWTIPTEPGTDSLNAAIAGAVALWSLYGRPA